MSFKAVQRKIEGEGHSAKAAGAILAHSTRNASPAAKKANPNLNKVKGEPDADDAPKKKAKKHTPSPRPQWAEVADQMLASRQGKQPGPGAA